MSLGAAMAQSAEHGRRFPQEGRRYTDPQRAYLSMTARLALWLMFNQGGKSTGLADDVCYTARGIHPFRPVHPAPVELGVVSYSQQQMKPLIGKIWEGFGRWEMDPKLSYSSGGGLKGYKDPHITLVDGPGRGSVIHFMTYKQGTEALAGRTLHGLFGDEPMPEAVYGELIPRLARYQGTFRIVQTITPDSPPQRYLKRLVDAGIFDCLQVPFTMNAITPRGGLLEVPWLTPRQAHATFEAYLGDELGLRRDALWEVPSSSRWLLNFHTTYDAVPPEHVTWVVAIDHGEGAGRQYACLVAIASPTALTEARAWFVDESHSDGRTTPEQDAAAIRAMLDRQGLTHHDVSHWVGDMPTGRTEDDRTKSNELLRKHLHRQLGHDPGAIELPKKGAGSRRDGARTINALLARRDRHDLPLCVVHKRCDVLADAFRYFDGTAATKQHSHAFDAARYGVTRLINLSGTRELHFGAPWAR